MQAVDTKTNPENVIAKSNMLIESSFKLTTVEQKLILTLTSYINPSDIDFNTYTISIKEFVSLLGLSSKSKYKELKDITKSLMKKVYEIKIGEDLVQVSWLSYVKYNEKQGSIDIRFDGFWKPFLLELQREFTTYRLGNITHLKSGYSIRMYELLKQYQIITERTFYLEDLRDKLGLEPEQYPKYGNFKQRILLKTKEELKNKSDISFEYEEIKKGRSVYKIKFFIYKNFIDAAPTMTNKQEDFEVKSPEQTNIESRLTTIGVNKKIIKELMKYYPIELIKRNVDYTLTQMSKGQVNKPVAFVQKAIEANYAASSVESSHTDEVIPEWFRQRKKQAGSQSVQETNADDKIKNGTDQEKREYFFKEYGSLEDLEKKLMVLKEDITITEQSLLKISNRSEATIEQSVDRNLTKEILDHIKKRVEFGVEAFNPLHFKDPYIRELSWKILNENKSLITT